MFVKLVILAFFAACASAAYNGPLAGGLPAAQFPAGVDPQACPNYPDCENPAVAVRSDQITYYNPNSQYQHPNAIHQYNQQRAAVPQYQQYNPAPQYNPAIQYNTAPQYQQPAQQRQYSPAEQSALDRGEYIGDGDYHGEGLAESGALGLQGQVAKAAAPVYNTLHTVPQAHFAAAPQVAYNQAPSYNSIAPQHEALARSTGIVEQPAQFPAGLDPRACPNYPFCS